MKVKVKFFSAHREAAGRREAEIEVDDGTNVNSLLDILFDAYPQIFKRQRGAEGR